MDNISKEIQLLIQTEIFQKFLCTDAFKLAQLNALTNLLIKANIDFDTRFTSETRRSSKSITVTIYINSSTTITRTFLFDE
ncbi:hypothetical protein [Tepidibacter formicigenes]|uniref:Uncharacterized protein n=1 Tax=Tepidibacter formicigenes DSM 15518 TaxID=1123349 RepID=A0A1M6PDD7_9FIRM|nr:hypothetical protein [Tepidibacter formicigenes]SHK05937.1 hypothetical protein SAMN02744037_01530 [Tepidibacter formicigenes DSM 15518]